MKIIKGFCCLKYSRLTFGLTVQQQKVAIITDSATERRVKGLIRQTWGLADVLTYRIGLAELASFILLSLQEKQKMLPQFLQ